MTSPDTTGSETIPWAGFNAQAVTSGTAQLVWSPQRGGKIVSLRGPDGVEWLTQPELPLPPPAQPGAAFTEAEMCGWDECAPSITACQIDGRQVHDHGNYWTARWQRQAGRDWWAAQDPAFGTDLARRVQPVKNGFRLNYRASTVRAADFLWAAHPQFAAPPGSRIEAPGLALGVVDVLGGEARPLTWDPALSQIDTVAPGGVRKFYARPDQPTGQATLRRGDRHQLTLSWDQTICPYVGFWFERAAFARQDVIAIEPSTGYFDNLVNAAAIGQVAHLSPGRTIEWWLEISFQAVGSGQQARRPPD
ncbi:MAG: hypothetical protein LBJ62_06470 [Bifidobacteriaceae bacterium]|jgi:hypothetical protein|nr:hypothetical protein [Bifidobacteriaceae bacterium]